MTEQGITRYLATSLYDSVIGVAIHLGRKLVGRPGIPPRHTYHRLHFSLKCHEPAGQYRCITCRRNPDSLRGHKRVCIAHHNKALWYSNCDLVVGRPTLIELDAIARSTGRQNVPAQLCQGVTRERLQEAIERS